MEIKSTSKINIGLHVHNKRSDGFHNISTLFQEIDLCDTIKMIEDKKFSCTTDCGTIMEKDNFGTKAFNIMKAQYPNIPNVRISIKKTVPTNAGLGGGSSNGTAVLVGLNNLFKLELTNQKLSKLRLFSNKSCVVYLCKSKKVTLKKKVVPKGGIEPPTRGFSVLCSTN